MTYSLDQQKYLQTLGRSVREIRRQKGWSQEEFSQKSGLHRTYIGSVERGERNVSILNIRLLALVLDTDISTIVAAQ